LCYRIKLIKIKGFVTSQKCFVARYTKKVGQGWSNASHDRGIWLPAFLAIFSASLLLILVPSHHSLWRQGDWMKNVNHFDCTYSSSLFHVVGRFVKRLTGIRLWGRMCDPYVKVCFLTAIPQSSHENIPTCIVTSIDFLSKSFSLIGKSVGSIWSSLQTSQYLCLWVSHWVVPWFEYQCKLQGLAVKRMCLVSQMHL